MSLGEIHGPTKAVHYWISFAKIWGIDFTQGAVVNSLFCCWLWFYFGWSSCLVFFRAETGDDDALSRGSRFHAPLGLRARLISHWTNHSILDYLLSLRRAHVS